MPRGRLLKWFTTLRNLQALADNSQLSFDLLDDLSASQTEGSTITRMLVEFWIQNDTINNPKTMDWGIVLLGGESVTAGAFPDADVEDERVDWIARGRMHAFTNGLHTIPAQHVERDLRAQRIIRDEFQKLTLVLNSDTNGAGGLFVTFIIRVLLRMP